MMFAERVAYAFKRRRLDERLGFVLSDKQRFDLNRQRFISAAARSNVGAS